MREQIKQIIVFSRGELIPTWISIFVGRRDKLLYLEVMFGRLAQRQSSGFVYRGSESSSLSLGLHISH